MWWKAAFNNTFATFIYLTQKEHWWVASVIDDLKDANNDADTSFISCQK